MAAPTSLKRRGTEPGIASPQPPATREAIAMKPIQSVPDTEGRGARAVAPQRQTAPSAAATSEHRRFQSHSPSERHRGECSQTEPDQSLASSAHLTGQRVTRLGVARNTPWIVINNSRASFTGVQDCRTVASGPCNRTF